MPRKNDFKRYKVSGDNDDISILYKRLRLRLPYTPKGLDSPEDSRWRTIEFDPYIFVMNYARTFITYYIPKEALFILVYIPNDRIDFNLYYPHKSQFPKLTVVVDLEAIRVFRSAADYNEPLHSKYDLSELGGLSIDKLWRKSKYELIEIFLEAFA